MLIETALAPVPDLSVLRELEPGVAYLALVVVLVTVVLFYVGPAIRARLMRAADRPDPPAASPDAALTTAEQPPQLPAAIDRADAVYEKFIAHLLEQLDDRDRELEARDVQQKRMEQRLALLADENARLRARKPWRAE